MTFQAAWMVALASVCCPACLAHIVYSSALIIILIFLVMILWSVVILLSWFGFLLLFGFWSFRFGGKGRGLLRWRIPELFRISRLWEFRMFHSLIACRPHSGRLVIAKLDWLIAELTLLPHSFAKATFIRRRGLYSNGSPLTQLGPIAAILCQMLSGTCCSSLITQFTTDLSYTWSPKLPTTHSSPVTITTPTCLAHF